MKKSNFINSKVMKGGCLNAFTTSMTMETVHTV